MTDAEKIAQRKKDLRDVLRGRELTVDVIAHSIERRFLDAMIEEGQKYADEMMVDYNFLVSHEVKEIVLQDFMRVNDNVRALKYVNKHHPTAVPSVGGSVGTYKDAMI